MMTMSQKKEYKILITLMAVRKYLPFHGKWFQPEENGDDQELTAAPTIICVVKSSNIKVLYLLTNSEGARSN